MKKLSTLCVLILAGVISANAQREMLPQGPCPEFQGESLEGKKVQLPQDGKGKFTLLVIASSMKAEKELRNWIPPLYETIASDPFRQVNVYFIPVMAGVNERTAKNIEERMRKEVHVDAHQHILMYRGDADELLNRLQVNDKDKPYFIVVDPRGEIIHRTSGSYSARKLNEIDDAFDQ